METCKFLVGAQLETADVIFTREKDFYGRAIAWATRGWREEKTMATHQELVFSPAQIFSYNYKKGPVIYSLSERSYQLFMEKREWSVFRFSSMKEPEKLHARTLMNKAMMKTQYSRAELGLQLIDGLLAKMLRRESVLFARRLGRLSKDKVVCSTGSNLILKNLGRLPLEAEFYSPDDTHDWLTADNACHCVYVSPGWFD